MGITTDLDFSDILPEITIDIYACTIMLCRINKNIMLRLMEVRVEKV